MMDATRMDICCWMFLLGVIQVFWGLVQGLGTDDAKIGRLFGWYFGGVGLYFLLFFILVAVACGHQGELTQTIFDIHFFGSAGFLAVFHVFIVGYSVVREIRESLQPEANPQLQDAKTQG